jgi:tripartite-type tricarboxylate transporter receptor subunit TctC
VERDFAPVSMMATTPNVIVAPANSPIRTVRQMLDMARARPDAISYASSGVGSQLHLQMVLRAKAGVEMQHVPYRGTTQALTDLLGGRVQLLSSNLPVALAGVREGRLHPIAVTTARRVAELPEVPTLAESGFPDIDIASWYGLLVPRATPAATVGAINAVAAEILRAPDNARTLANQGLDIVTEPPEVFAARIRRETALWAQVIRERNITAD